MTGDGVRVTKRRARNDTTRVDLRTGERPRNIFSNLRRDRGSGASGAIALLPTEELIAEDGGRPRLEIDTDS